MNFDIERFRELLKESNLLYQYQEGKSLQNSNKTKYDKLHDYISILQNNIFWESRKEQQQIINQFVIERITFDEFRSKYGNIRYSNFRTYEICKKTIEEGEVIADSSKTSEINLDRNTRASKFMQILSDINSDIDLVDHDITLAMNLKNPELIYYAMSPEFCRLYFLVEYVPRINELCS